MHSRKPHRGLALATAAALVAIAVGVSSGVASGGSEHANQVYCAAPYAYVPVVYTNRTGYAHADVYCPSGAGFTFIIRMLNRAGNVLAENRGGPIGGSYYIYTWPPRSCAGAYVRSHAWINTNGIGKSDTSGENPHCAY
jgi:hypothetical protein